jgi:subtilase family serine protease
MMSETLKDIENLETVVNLLEDGASDEKRSAMYMIKNMIANKKSQVKSFEDYYEENGFEPERN